MTACGLFRRTRSLGGNALGAVNCLFSRTRSLGGNALGAMNCLFRPILADAAAGEGCGKDEEERQNPVVSGHGRPIVG